jgi:CRISPR-associated endonuclease/helicase Cas3
MTYDRLLAKSRPKDLPKDHPTPDSILLQAHLADVYQAAEQVVKATGDDQVKVLGLPPEVYRKRFDRIVLLAAAVHDLGKANNHFQGMIHGNKDRAGRPQGLRHEWVTVLLLRQPEIRRWLLPAVLGNDLELATVEWAVAGHHPAYDRPSPPRHAALCGEGEEFCILSGHEDFHGCLRQLAEMLGLDEPPAFSGDERHRLIGPKNVFSQIASWYRDAKRTWDAIPITDPERRFVAAVKNSLIAADVAGSALPREVPDEVRRARWIGDAFRNMPRDGELREVVQKRLNTERKKGQPGKLRGFQEAVGASTASVTFVKAGCGSGKTVAAYHWAATQHPTRRLYFCYPTTGTATEGYKGYLFDPAAEANHRLFHGRADVDLAGLLGTAQDEPETDTIARIESLDSWSTPVVSCTVDVVLGLVQNNRRALYAWPALAGSAFIFDEVHAYDDRLFGALLRFLQALPGAPVLAMTASLSTARLQALNSCLARIGRPPLTAIPGPEETEAIKRYQQELAKDPFQRATEELEQGGSVLWVTNTVDRAMTAADRLKDHRPKVYHSRFRYLDRVQRHREIIDLFDPAKQEGPALACCTQVAEMSLDLSATLLVTELAPVPALIQRLGRLNRRAQKDDPWPFVVIDVAEDHLPYTPGELDAARKWLAELGQQSLSQQDLAEKWKELDASARPDYVASAWLDGGPSTTVQELREASPGISVILADDLPALRRYDRRLWEAARQRRKLSESEQRPREGEHTLAEVLLPMPPPPRKLDWRSDDSYKGVPVAKKGSILYDSLRGGTWRKEM